MIEPLVKVLAANDLSPDQFQDSAGNETVFNGVVPYKGVLELWGKFVNAFKDTGYYPVLRGEVADQTRDDWTHDPEKILAGMPDGTVRELLMPRLRERIESFKDFADELPEASRGELARIWDNDPPDFDATAAALDRSGVNSFSGATELAPWPPDKQVSSRANFHTTRQSKGKPMVMSLVRVKKAFELPAYLNFGGWNDAPDPALQAAVIREWRQKYAAIPVCITRDVLEFMVHRPPQTQDEAMQLAAEQWIFCDDIVGQGTQSVRKLAIEIWRAPTWFFWWD